ncbi:hypothetical protein Tco_0237047 [Tanacetum coccineum]
MNEERMPTKIWKNLKNEGNRDGRYDKIEKLEEINNGGKSSENKKITLGVIDLDHALRNDPPATQTAESIADHKRACAQWERSNRMSIKNYISVAIRGAIPNSENTKEYLSSLEEQLKGLQKPMQINYNAQKEKWNMNELIAMCVEEEEHLKVEKLDVVHVTTTNSNKRKGSWKGKVPGGLTLNPWYTLLILYRDFIQSGDWNEINEQLKSGMELI